MTACDSKKSNSIEKNVAGTEKPASDIDTQKTELTELEKEEKLRKRKLILNISPNYQNVRKI